MRHSQRKRGANKIGRTFGAARQSSTLPTDSSLLGDGVRVLIRAMKRIGEIAEKQGAKLRDRSRSVKRRILEIGRAARTKGGPNRERLQQGYAKLLSAVGRVVGQAKRFSRKIAEGVKRSADVMQQATLEGLGTELDTFVPRVQQVVQQAKQRIFGGDNHVAREVGEYLRAHHRNHSQRQGQ